MIVNIPKDIKYIDKSHMDYKKLNLGLAINILFFSLGRIFFENLFEIYSEPNLMDFLVVIIDIITIILTTISIIKKSSLKKDIVNMGIISVNFLLIGITFFIGCSSNLKVNLIVVTISIVLYLVTAIISKFKSIKKSNEVDIKKSISCSYISNRNSCFNSSDRSNFRNIL